MADPINIEVAKIILDSCKDLIASYVDKGPAIPGIIGKVAVIQIDSALEQLSD